MDAHKFLDNFATIAEAPGGVDRLRSLVFGLAASGHLSEALPDDRTPSVPGLVLAPERPSLLPHHWIWAELGTVGPPGERATADGPFGSKLKTSDYVDQPGFRVLRLGNIGVRTFKDADRSYISKAHFADLAGYHLRSGDVLVASLGNPCGRACLVPDHALPAINKADCFRIRPHEDVNPAFLVIALNSPAALARAADLNRGDTRGRITLSHLKQSPVPLPPLAEQDRIVAKVDELMDLCNDLEARQERYHRATTRFRTSALRALTQAETTDGMLQAWERLDANWEAVTSTAEDVGSLQATVLQLAVEGRLVSRLPHEGTADQTLSAVNEERARLVRDGAIARPKTSIPVARDERPYELPEHWKWVHVEDVVTHIVDCLHRTPPYATSGIPAIRTSDIEPGRVLTGKARRVDEATFLEQTRRLVPEEGDVLYSREGGRFGIAAVVPPKTKLCLSQRMMQFRCAAAVSPDYFSWFLNSPLGFGQATEDVGGSASPHVNIKSIRRFVMPLPPTGEQQRIAEAISRMLGAIDDLALSLERQEERASLLADAASALAAG